MAEAKYKKFYTLMWQKNGEKLKAFKEIHDAYVANATKHEEDFHAEGKKILDIIRDWERRLCSGMNRGQYAQYSQKLSEKFWDEVRKDFSEIDLVGVKRSKV